MHLLIFTLTVLLLTVACYTSALNILAIFPFQGRSHFIVFKVLLEELAQRGHNLTVISHFPQEDPPQNYHDISLAGKTSIIQDVKPLEKKNRFLSLLYITNYLTTTGRENCDLMLANNKVLSLVREKRKFDVVVVQQFNSDCALGIAYKLGAPVVGVTSHGLMPWHYDRFGVPSNPAFVPVHYMDSGTHPSLLQKIEGVLTSSFVRLRYYFLCQRYNQASLDKHFGEIPPLADLGRQIKFLLLYQHCTLTGSYLLPSNVIEVGGYHVPKAKPLTGDLEKFVDDAEPGIIYISFGSMVKFSTIRQEHLEAILEAIAAFPHRIVCRWDVSSIDKPPFTNLPMHMRQIITDKNKLFTSNWLPQVDILAHPKTLAFFSHAGMGGTSEAISFGVPMVAMPLAADQPGNAAALVENGLGVKLDFSDLTKENLIAALSEVLDPRFYEKTKRLSKLWHDRPLSSLDTAVYWIEYTARNANFTFSSPSAGLPIYLYLNLDLIGVFCVFIITLVCIVRLAFLVCCRRTTARQISTKQKKH